MADYVLWISMRRYLEFQHADVYIGAEGPEVWLLHAEDSLQLGDALVAAGQQVVQLARLALHQDTDRLSDQRQHRDGDGGGDEHGTDRVGDHPAELVHQNGRNDDADAAQRVGQDVQEHALHDLRVGALRQVVAVAVVVSTVRVTVTSVV